MKKKLSSWTAAAVAALAFQSVAPVASASIGDSGHSTGSYVGSVLASAVYFPAKVVFAVGGAVTSGVAYAATLGNPYPSQDIWNKTVEGDYVVTPSMIDGRERVDFVGP